MFLFRSHARVEHCVQPALGAGCVRKQLTSSMQLFRQYLCELSLLAATNPKVLRALVRINHEVTAKYFRNRAAASGVVGKTHVHRLGSSLNLLLHLHVCFFDGLFVQRDNDAPSFFPARPLSKDDLCQLVETIAVRTAK